MKTAFIVFAAALAVFSSRSVLAGNNIVGVAATFAADKFYRTCLKLDPWGLPTPDQMDRFEPLFTEDLTGMIEDARRHRNMLLRENPAGRLPWCEGNLFSSLRDGFTFYAVGVPVVLDDIATVPVHLEYRYQGHITRWIDVMVLQRSGRRWLVADIFLNAPWTLTSGTSLRARLWMSMQRDAFHAHQETVAASRASAGPS